MVQYKGIMAKTVDSIAEFEDRDVWLRRFREMSKAFSDWTAEKVGVPVDFQEQITVVKERKGVNDDALHKDLVLRELDYSRGRFLQNGFNVLIYVFDTYEPWYHTPEYDPSPLNTTGFTNVGDTTVVSYVEPGAIGDPEPNIRKVLSITMSLELLHMLLYRKQMLAGKRPDSKYFDNAVHENYDKDKFEEFEGFTFLEVPAEP